MLLYVSQGHESATGETQYEFGFISTRRIDLFGLFFYFFFVWFKETMDGTQVKMSRSPSLSSRLAL